MPQYRFPGYAVFLRDAARRIGHPEADVPARRITTLAALGNLCAQAGAADPKDVSAIMVKAGEFRDQLHAAYKAAELMISETSNALAFDVDPKQKHVRPGLRDRIKNRTSPDR